MNKAEKVSALEALLSRIQTNAGEVRARRPAGLSPTEVQENPADWLAFVAPAPSTGGGAPERTAAPARSLSPVRTPALEQHAPSPAPARDVPPARETPGARPEPAADRSSPKPLRMPFSGSAPAATQTPVVARSAEVPAASQGAAGAPTASSPGVTGGGGLRIPAPRASDPGQRGIPKSGPQAARPIATRTPELTFEVGDEPTLDRGVPAPAASPAPPPVAAPLAAVAAPAPAPVEHVEAPVKRPTAPAFEPPIVGAPVVDIDPASRREPPHEPSLPIVEAPAPAPAPVPVAAAQAPAPHVLAATAPLPAPAPATAAAADIPPAPRPSADLAAPASNDSSRWVAPPPAEARPATRRSTVLVLFAAVVVLVAAAVFGYLQWVKQQRIDTAPKAAPAMTAKPADTGAAPVETAAPSAADTATPGASAAPAASAEAAEAEVEIPKDPKTLPATIGYLIVKTKTEGVGVMDSGKKVGAVSTAIEVPCTGTGRYIGLGKELAGGAMQPVGEGRSVKIECQAVTTIELP